MANTTPARIELPAHVWDRLNTQAYRLECTPTQLARILLKSALLDLELQLEDATALDLIKRTIAKNATKNPDAPLPGQLTMEDTK